MPKAKKRKPSLFNKRVGELIKLAKTGGDPMSARDAFKEAVRVVQEVARGDLTMAAARALMTVQRRLGEEGIGGAKARAPLGFLLGFKSHLKRARFGHGNPNASRLRHGEPGRRIPFRRTASAGTTTKGTAAPVANPTGADARRISRQ